MFKVVLVGLLLICGLPLIFGVLAIMVFYPAWFLAREEREW
ncbi:hypothetical protein ANRL1_00423 [Anaerolineae bacterium]|nr:hypothetical protein ANRL1_00423 [Anaerolineae bacterium]